MTERIVAYRHAAYDTPWRAFPSGRDGRFHRARFDTAQYWSLHPLGPAAEILRRDLGPRGDPDEVLLDLWAASIDVEGVHSIGFDECAAYGIAPEELVGDDYLPTRALADRLRAEGAAGLIAPSAALPGTDTLVLFGARLIASYLTDPVDPVECPTGHLSAAARPAAEVAPLVRWLGTPHAALKDWRLSGTYRVLKDPLASRRRARHESASPTPEP